MDGICSSEDDILSPVTISSQFMMPLMVDTKVPIVPSEGEMERRVSS